MNDSKISVRYAKALFLTAVEKGLVDEALVNFEKSQIYSETLPEKSQSRKSLSKHISKKTFSAFYFLLVQL